MRYQVTRLRYASGAKAGQPNGLYQIDYDGQQLKLPSVTTVIKAGLPAPQLVQWALRLGVQTAMQLIEERQGEDGVVLGPDDLAEIRAKALAEPDRFRDEAADIGTQVHDTIEAWLRGDAPGEDLTSTDPRVSRGFQMFLNFWHYEGLEVELDLLEHPTASIRHSYAGTVDCVALDKQFRRVLIDWKTSKGIYDSHEIQAVAYAKAIEEQGLGPVDRIMVARFGREDAAFESREIPRTLWDSHFQQFLRCMGTHDWLKMQRAAWIESKRAK